LQTRRIHIFDPADLGRRYCPKIGLFSESLPFIETAQSVAILLRSSLPKYSLDGSRLESTIKQLDAIISETHHNLGCIRTKTNRPEFTLIHFKMFNELMIQEIDETRQNSDKRFAISWNELGNAYIMNKMWEKGEECFKECLTVAQQMSDFKPEEFSFPCVNLGLAYWLIWRLDEAEQTMLEGLHFRECRCG